MNARRVPQTPPPPPDLIVLEMTVEETRDLRLMMGACNARWIVDRLAESGRSPKDSEVHFRAYVALGEAL